MIRNKPYYQLMQAEENFNHKESLSEALIELEKDSREILSRVKDLKNEVNILSQIFLAKETEDDTLSRFEFFREIPHYMVFQSIYKKGLEEDKKIYEGEAQKDINNIDSTGLMLLEERNSVLEDILRDSNESLEEIAVRKLKTINRKQIKLSDLVNSVTTIEEIKVLLGLCLLHHFWKISIDLNENKHYWEVNIHEL